MFHDEQRRLRIRTTNAAIRSFEDALKAMRKNGPGALDPKLYEASIAAAESQLTDLREELSLLKGMKVL